MPPAIIAAGVGAAASIGGSVLASKSAKKATNTAVAAQQQGDAAALAAQQAMYEKNLAQQKEMFDTNSAMYGQIRDENLAYLTPWNDLGLEGAKARNALLGLPTPAARPATTPALPAPAPATPTTPPVTTLPAPAPATPALPATPVRPPNLPVNLPLGLGTMAPYYPTGTPINPNGGTVYQPATTSALPAPATPARELTAAQQRILERREDMNDRREARGQDPLPPPAFMRDRTTPAATTTPGATTPALPAPTAAAADTGTNYEDAFQRYLDSSGYKFRYDQGVDAMEHALRLQSLDSGNTIKSAIEYGQGMMGSYFNDYMGLLGQQQGMGLTAAGNIAGMNSNYATNMANMGSSYGNNLANLNSQMGNAIAGNAQNNGALLGNAALANGQNNANMWGGIAGGIGQIAGGFGSSGYGTPTVSNYNTPITTNNALQWGSIYG